MIKDELIKIICSNCDDYGISDRGQAEEFTSGLMFDINKKLRCDQCKYWTAPTEAWQSGLGECRRLKDDTRKAGTIEGAQGGYCFLSKPDFFCALWE